MLMRWKISCASSGVYLPVFWDFAGFGATTPLTLVFWAAVGRFGGFASGMVIVLL
jgi:hypothetical protein